MANSNIDLIREYFQLLEGFVTERARFERVLHADFVQREFPNGLNRHGQESDLTETLRRAEMGKKILALQTFQINGFLEGADKIVVEADWTGKMAVSAGPLKAGQVLRAHFCIVCELKDGKIHRQRNYDCFEPFEG